jgi:hypothetical protein
MKMIDKEYILAKHKLFSTQNAAELETFELNF